MREGIGANKNIQFMKNLLIILLMAFSLSSCTKDFKISDCDFDCKYNKAFLDEKPYSGSLWNETKDVEIICEGGIMLELRVYHSDGSLAIRELKKQREFRWYNEAGTPIGRAEFTEKYPFEIKKMKETNNLIKEKDIRGLGSLF